MARKPKKRKYTKRSNYWPSVAVPKLAAALAKPAAWEKKSDDIFLKHHRSAAFSTRDDAMKASPLIHKGGKPYVCPECGEWHVGVR